jgi:lipid-A-disaccharide synthase
MKTVMIVTGESSGELYGSLLAKELKKSYPDVRIVGIGGDRMRKVGVELISGISSAFGISELFSALRDLKSAFKRTKETITELMPDVLVLIDFPDFNIKVAGFAKACKIKILYYVSPQVWAWRKGRVKKIAGLVDRMAVILPFEADIYRRAGVQCEFVGHPIVEEIEEVLQSSVNSRSSLVKPSDQCPVTSDRSANPSLATLNPKLRTYFKGALGFDSNRPLLSLLPGSRPHELKRLLPLMIEVIREFKRGSEINSGKDYQFCIPLAPNINEVKYRQYIDALIQEGAIIKRGETIQVLAASDMAVIASGTATLQAAFLEVPMVVIYKLSTFSYLLGRLFINVKHISLVNILSGGEIVPELLQQKANPEDIIKKLKKIMFDVVYREGMINQFKKIKGPFWGLKASNRVSGIIEEMAGWGQ